MNRRKTCRWILYTYAKDGSGDLCFGTACGAKVRCGADFAPRVCGTCGRPVERAYEYDKVREDK